MNRTTNIDPRTRADLQAAGPEMPINVEPAIAEAARLGGIYGRQIARAGDQNAAQQILVGRAFIAGLRNGLEQSTPAGHQLNLAAAAELNIAQSFLGAFEDMIRDDDLWHTDAEALAVAEAAAEREAEYESNPVYAVTAAELARLAPAFLAE